MVNGLKKKISIGSKILSPEDNSTMIDKVYQFCNEFKLKIFNHMPPIAIKTNEDVDFKTLFFIIKS